MPSVDVRKTANHKITTIERALWLVERSVCMTVCKHDSVVKMFCFSRANHASKNLKTFLSSKLDKFTFLPIPSSAQTCKIFTNKLWQFPFRLSWHFKREKSVFWNFLQNKNWLRVQDFVFQDFATGKSFSFN